MAYESIRGETAWRTVRGARHLRWSNNHESFNAQVYPVAHTPKFKLSPDDRIFCIGSCFARNIEEHLTYRGIKVLSQGLVIPRREFGGRPGGILNKFTTFSMLQELEWMFNPPAIDASLFSQDVNDQWLDLQLSSGAKPVTLERAMERRSYLLEEYFTRVKQADVVIMTLGLIETWRDLQTGVYLNVPPPAGNVLRNGDRYVLEITDYNQNVAALAAIRTRLLELNPDLRIIATVSPIPLGISFSGLDPVIANSLSKSVLRASVQTILDHPNVDYFPSFEMVTAGAREEAFADDCRHAKDSTVAKVIDFFLNTYTAGLENPEPEFSELGYLAANPDVDRAVRSGEWDNGFQHYMAQGKAEGRPLRPADGPSRLMRKSGMS